MSSWTNRETKLQQRHLNKSFSRPFKKKLEKDLKKKEHQKIREAQRAKWDNMGEDDDVSDE